MSASNNESMGLKNSQSTWRKWGALVCLVVFFSVSVSHPAHICPLYSAPVQHGPVASVSLDCGSICITCLALHSSAAEPLFSPSVPQGVAPDWPPALYESPLKPSRFFQFFVRPPPAV